VAEYDEQFVAEFVEASEAPGNRRFLAVGEMDRSGEKVVRGLRGAAATIRNSQTNAAAKTR
jgi:hypothetical protein